MTATSQALGRIHDAHEARRAIDLAQRTFERVNIDLMYALPQQTMDEAMQDVSTALGTGVSHLSCYHLTLEPNTPFAAHPPQLPDDDASADMQDAIEARLAEAGFVHYETSAFAQPGRQCLHNLNYWQFGDYLGIGAGAHGKLTLRRSRAAEHREAAAAGRTGRADRTSAAAHCTHRSGPPLPQSVAAALPRRPGLTAAGWPAKPTAASP
jgi:coproporphyrinogen III oxidase-like Fe-S oxidoreductase